MITDPIFYLGAVPAVILMGLAKGGLSGLSLLSLPLMALVVSPVQAAAIMLPILMVQDVVTVWVYRHTWDRRNVLIILPAAVVGILIGYLWAAEVSDAAVRLSLGIISVTFAVRRLVLERGSNEVAPTKADLPRGLFWGAVCGFTSMIAHAGGPPFQIYVMPQRLPQTIFVGTGAVVFGIINWMKVPPYIALGQISAENLTTAAALFPVGIAATYAGVWLVRRISGRVFYTSVYALLVLVGAKLVFDGVSGLL
ncbi:sulfite exporter TauE/SafE family protein [Microvirga brassicacearum]|uniref:Probable membrane transporter protein n=1 Tax=Microvirga brassicacearum TaxID=2580413 RepID=A0A5N3PGU3_9HYPH|nr:sulfite exporter TauE/SafE family protein [Microvirga brassicacearum]KAB0268952.1 sulfite exporter TauE/SafE family protein [Microvirga brassicacearum]